MVAWGLAYVPSAWLIESLPPFVAGGVRLGVGGVALLVGLVAAGISLRPGIGVRYPAAIDQNGCIAVIKDKRRDEIDTGTIAPVLHLEQHLLFVIEGPCT